MSQCKFAIATGGHDAAGCKDSKMKQSRSYYSCPVSFLLSDLKIRDGKINLKVDAAILYRLKFVRKSRNDSGEVHNLSIAGTPMFALLPKKIVKKKH